MESLGEGQKAECPGSYQHPRLSDLKETMVSNVVFLLLLWENLRPVQAGKARGGRVWVVGEKRQESLVHMWHSQLCITLRYVQEYDHINLDAPTVITPLLTELKPK